MAAALLPGPSSPLLFFGKRELWRQTRRREGLTQRRPHTTAAGRSAARCECGPRYSLKVIDYSITPPRILVSYSLPRSDTNSCGFVEFFFSSRWMRNRDPVVLNVQTRLSIGWSYWASATNSCQIHLYISHRKTAFLWTS